MRTASLLLSTLLVAGAALMTGCGADHKPEVRQRDYVTGIRFAPPPTEAERARLLAEWASQLAREAEASQLPAITEKCASEERARSEVAEAMRASLVAHVRSQSHGALPNSVLLSIHSAVPPPPPESIAILTSDENGATRYQAAVRMVVPDDAVSAWRQAIQEQRQAAATLQAIYIASGLLAFMGILALQAKLNHAWSGKRTGILRAAAMVAILCLLGGMTAAAAAARIFSV